MKRETSQKIIKICAAPLILYPFVMLANLMSLGGFDDGSNMAGLVMSYLVIFATSTYLITYIASYIYFKSYANDHSNVVLAPVIHLGVIIILAFIWGMV